MRGVLSALAVSNSSNWRVIGNDISCPNGSGTGSVWPLTALAHGSFYRNLVHDNGSTTSVSKLYQAIQFDTGSNAIDFGWNEVANTRSCLVRCSFILTLRHLQPTVHDNLIHDARCDGINFATIDPALGAVTAYNNIIYLTGTGPAPGGVESSYAGIKVAGTNSAAVKLTQNTFYDNGGRRNADSGAVSATASVVLPITSSAPCRGRPTGADLTTSMFSGSNNLFFGAGAIPTFSSASKSADPKFVAAGSNFQLQSRQPGD